MSDEKKAIRGTNMAGIAVSALLTACGAAQASGDPAPAVAETETSADEAPPAEEPVEPAGEEAGGDESEEEAEDPPYNAGGGRG